MNCRFVLRRLALLGILALAVGGACANGPENPPASVLVITGEIPRYSDASFTFITSRKKAIGNTSPLQTLAYLLVAPTLRFL